MFDFIKNARVHMSGGAHQGNLIRLVVVSVIVTVVVFWGLALLLWPFEVGAFGAFGAFGALLACLDPGILYMRCKYLK